MDQIKKPSRLADRERDISSEWLSALVESAPDGVITMDDKGRIIAFNLAAEKIFGYRGSQVTGRRVADVIIPKALRKAHKSGLRRFLNTGEKKIIGRRIEVRAMRADQSVFPAEMWVIPVNLVRSQVFIAYIRDISKQKQAEQEHRKYSLNIKKTLVQTILAISRTVEIRDPYTAGHQHRVAHLAAALAETLQLSEAVIESVFMGALIHDIGKIAVPPEILSRPGRLLEEDVKYLQIHCLKGYEILRPVDFPWPVAEIAFQHHEHMDGSGYPQGLRGEEIIPEARIVCVADVVESLTSHRPYRPAYPLDEALRIITGKAAKWYDRDITAACRSLFKSGYKINKIDMEALTWISTLSE
jgi:PAS domain S-box-containing protein/putative nucleotidyltransferase with HDIG domain